MLLLCCINNSNAQHLLNAVAGYNDGDCALMLSGGGRSSAFDYNLNMFRGGYHQPMVHMDRTCVTYGAINNAYLDARKRIRKWIASQFAQNSDGLQSFNYTGFLMCWFITLLDCTAQRLPRRPANGKRKILRPSVNYCWTSPYNWPEREYWAWTNYTHKQHNFHLALVILYIYCNT